MNSASTDSPELTFILGLPFHRLTMAEALEDCRDAMDTALDGGDAARYFVTPNLDFARLAFEDRRLRKIVFKADRILCDGLPLVWLSRRFGAPLPERVAGSDLTPRLLDLCAEMGKSVYFLGSDPRTLEKAAVKLRERHPSLRIAGRESPPLGPIEDWDNAEIVRRIRESGADVLLVALGCPKQEYWIDRHLRETGVRLALGVGASLDFIAGTQRRAPRGLQALGLEWAWRLASSPRRLARRYLADIGFILRHSRRQAEADSGRLTEMARLIRLHLRHEIAETAMVITPEELCLFNSHELLEGLRPARRPGVREERAVPAPAR